MSGIVVTGFDAFATLDENISESVVRALPSAWRRPERLWIDVLPTIYSVAEQRICDLIAAHEPEAVVLLGVARSQGEIHLERAALNIDDSETADNDAQVRRGRLIEPQGPVGYWSTLPLEAMLARLAALGVPAVISNHAGSFVCNHVFFAASAEIECRGGRARCGFIHLPGRADAQLGGDVLVAAVVSCLEVVADAMTRRPNPSVRN